MDKNELLEMLAKKKVSGCCLGSLGYALGHLTDHDLDETEVRAAVDFILNGVFKLKNNPDMVSGTEKFLENLTTVMGR